MWHLWVLGALDLDGNMKDFPVLSLEVSPPGLPNCPWGLHPSSQVTIIIHAYCKKLEKYAEV